MEDIKIYTPEEVAELLKLKKATIQRHIRNGELKAFKVGRFWRIKEQDLKEFMNIANEE